jgi:hypothetical protein
MRRLRRADVWAGLQGSHEMVSQGNIRNCHESLVWVSDGQAMLRPPSTGSVAPVT